MYFCGGAYLSHLFFIAAMDQITALILTVRKNTGNNVIVDCYTKELGRKAFIYSFTKKNKGHKALLSPMNWINFSVQGSVHQRLQRIKDLQPYHLYQSIGNHPVKNLIALFLSEVIASTVKEEYEDQDLFLFLENALWYFDELPEAYENFHLSFLVGLAAMLGIAPPVDQEDINDANYAMWLSKMNPSEQASFKQICLCPINQAHHLQISGKERRQQLNYILDYLQHYAAGFKMPKSLELFRHF